MYKVLMVCLGNICRSPLAQGILEDLAKKRGLSIKVDSAGTGSWHIGSSPDQRSIEVAKNHNIDISTQKARQFNTKDFKYFDKIYVMDTMNYSNIIRLCSNKIECEKVELILKATDPEERLSVPDPYYDNDGFENVYKLLKSACDEIIKKTPTNGKR
ncbi:MAG: low molecular weight phosphotyrosine protein phosphatase [Flavobacteriales bacterium]|jgi:protein-tyrosine phosphatase|nr:low molecular weight phosphotyrosine protein phosphatase [Flavobacteriales bacterium]MDG1440657.1 low molecular weight phosphotyrosine protein phosphatase [Flavobacteriales bacterium]